LLNILCRTESVGGPLTPSLPRKPSVGVTATVDGVDSVSEVSAALDDSVSGGGGSGVTDRVCLPPLLGASDDNVADALQVLISFHLISSHLI